MRAVLPIALLSLVLALPARADEALEWAEKAYKINASVQSGAVKAGDKVRLRIDIETILPDAKVHPEAPIKVKLAAPDALKLPKEKLTRADGRPEGKGYRFDLTADAAQAGNGNFEASVDFFICSERWCVKQSARASTPVKVCAKQQATC